MNGLMNCERSSLTESTATDGTDERLRVGMNVSTIPIHKSLLLTVR